MKIACDSIKTLVYYFGADKTIEFDRMDAQVYPSDKTPQQLWLMVSRRGATTLYTYDALDFYGGIGRNQIDRFKGYWLCIRPNEKVAISISSADKKKADFIQAAVAYFKDDAELTKKIQSEQYKWNDMEAIVDEYNSWKRNNP